MKAFQRALAGVLSAALLLGLSGGALAAGRSGDFTLGIYSTTDMNGKCYDLDPVTGREINNSYLKVASAMAREREESDAVLLLDNGGVLRGSSVLSYSLAEEGGENPAALCLRYCGYDVFAPGGREFEFSQDQQEQFYEILADGTGRYPGGAVKVLRAGQEVRKPYVLRTFRADGKNFKVGVLSFESETASGGDLSGHAAGVGLDAAGDAACEWVNNWQKTLREKEKCDLVIVCVHAGAGDRETLDPVTGETGTEDRAERLVRSTTGVDLVVAGRGQAPGVRSYPNAEGKVVSVVDGGGTALTKTPVAIKKDGTFTVGRSELVDLTVCRNDGGLKELMEPYYQETAAFVGRELGTLSGKWDNVTDLVHIQSDTMDLVHEAQLWATGADVSVASPAAVRDFRVGALLEGRETGPISLKDCCSICPNNDNRLYMVELTGRQLKDWLEDCAKDYTVTESGLIGGGGLGTDQVYGVNYDVYLGEPEGNRVQNLTFRGLPVTPGQKFKAAVSSDRLSANDLVDPYGWYAATGATLGGSQVLWDASRSEQFSGVGGSCTLILAEYLKSLTAGGKAITPPEPRSRWTLNVSTGAEGMARITRLEFVERLYEAAGKPTAYLDLTQTFSDMEGEDPAAAWAVQAGIVQGNGEGQFLPGVEVTREQAAVMLMRYDTARGAGPVGAWAVRVPYTDAANVSTWASEALMWNTIRDYLPADSGGNFRPQAVLTAGELTGAIQALGK